MPICVACKEEIYEGLPYRTCPSCLSEEFETWMPPEMRRQYLRVKDYFLEITKGDATCLKCGSKFGICIYCFSELVYRTLLKIDEKVAHEFLEKFNYDFEGTGYTVDRFFTKELVSDEELEVMLASES